MATIILCLSSESFDERFYIIAKSVNTNDSTTLTKELVSLDKNLRNGYFSIKNLEKSENSNNLQNTQNSENLENSKKFRKSQN